MPSCLPAPALTNLPSTAMCFSNPSLRITNRCPYLGVPPYLRFSRKKDPGFIYLVLPPPFFPRDPNLSRKPPETRKKRQVIEKEKRWWKMEKKATPRRQNVSSRSLPLGLDWFEGAPVVFPIRIPQFQSEQTKPGQAPPKPRGKS